MFFPYEGDLKTAFIDVAVFPRLSRHCFLCYEGEKSRKITDPYFD